MPSGFSKRCASITPFVAFLAALGILIGFAFAVLGAWSFIFGSLLE